MPHDNEPGKRSIEDRGGLPPIGQAEEDDDPALWRARLNPARPREFRRFEQERTLPMFLKQPGFLGALLLREEQCVVRLTLRTGY